MCKFRELKAEEIKCRLARETATGIQLLLYKDARVDMAILDETVGIARWQREHYVVDGVVYCRVGVKIDNEWIWKSDCGVESFADGEKGESSDSFKRACVNFGIGRSLYTAPFIWIKKADYSLNDKGKCADSFSVLAIDIQDGEIKGLQVKNDKSGNTVYTFGTLRGGMRKAPEAPKAPDAASVPFPEAEKPAPKAPDAPKYVGGALPQISFEEAKTVKLNGILLTDLYKQDRVKFMEALNCSDPMIKAAALVLHSAVIAAQKKTGGK